MKNVDWEQAYRTLVGDRLNSRELEQTVKRAACAWGELLGGYQENLDSFSSALYQEEYSGMVVVKEIEFFSVCEHHLLPIIGKCAIGYLPKGKIIGLSKLPRIVDMYARRLQLQERLTEQIAQGVALLTEGKGVGVLITAQHLCMLARGIKQRRTIVDTESFEGDFQQEKVQAEFRRLIK